MQALTEALMALGERFRAAREERGLTLSEVAEQLRIRSVYLAAIEEENWKAIGAPVYTRGFLRTYARYLNLDPEEAVAEFNTASGVPSAPAPVLTEYEQRQRQRSLLPFIYIAAVVAVALIGFVIFLYVSPPRQAAVVASTPGTPPPSLLPSPRPQPALHVAPPIRELAMRLTEPSWVRVTIDGNVRMEGTFPAGTSKSFRGKSALVRVGNAGGVQLIIDGKRIGKLGREGDVVERGFKL